MKAVADTSALIHPAKVPLFWKQMRTTFEEILIPESVYEEIMKGKEKSRRDVPTIIAAIDNGWIKVRSGVKISRSIPGYLGEGERQAISLALKEKSDWLLIDDKLAHNIAETVGARATYSVYLLPFWVKKKVLVESEALKMLELLVKTGYYLRSTDYIAIKELIISKSDQH